MADRNGGAGEQRWWFVCDLRSQQTKAASKSAAAAPRLLHPPRLPRTRPVGDVDRREAPFRILRRRARRAAHVEQRRLEVGHFGGELGDARSLHDLDLFELSLCVLTGGPVSVRRATAAAVRHAAALRQTHTRCRREGSVSTWTAAHPRSTAARRGATMQRSAGATLRFLRNPSSARSERTLHPSREEANVGVLSGPGGS